MGTLTSTSFKDFITKYYQKRLTPEEYLSFLPIAYEHLKLGNTNDIINIIEIFTYTGYSFPIIKNWLVYVLCNDCIGLLHKNIVDSLSWGVEWYINMGNNGQMGDLKKDDIIMFINAVKSSCHLSRAEKEKFILQLRSVLPKNIREELIEANYFPLANGKWRSTEEIKCSAREKVPVLCKEYYYRTGIQEYSLCYCGFERKDFHKNRICACYCNCSDCWSSVCSVELTNNRS